MYSVLSFAVSLICTWLAVYGVTLYRRRRRPHHALRTPGRWDGDTLPI